MVDWEPGDVETAWSDELLLAVIADAALNPRENANEGLAANLAYLMLRIGLPQADAQFLNRVGDPNGGLSERDRRINEQFWRLVLRGVLVPDGGRFVVTEAGGDTKVIYLIDEFFVDQSEILARHGHRTSADVRETLTKKAA